MTTILVTGAAGQLGSEIRELSDHYRGYEFIFTDSDEMDITNGDETASFISRHQPSWIINCASYTAVDRAEEEEQQAMAVNATGVANIVKAIENVPCRLIHISTDYLFDGSRPLPYTEGDTPSPVTAYGRSKLAGEREAMRHNDTLIIRTSWLYSFYGHNFVKTILRRAMTSDRLNVVFDQVGTPTYAADLAEAIMSIVSGTIRLNHNFIPGILHYSNEGVCSWYDLATEIVSETASECIVTPVRSSDYPSKAVRPAYSVLDKAKIREYYNIEIPHWRTSLKRCITKINRI